MARSRELRVLVTGDTRNFEQSMRRLDGAVVRAEKSSDRAKRAFRGMAGAAGIGSAGFAFTKAIKVTFDFEKAMRNVNSIAQLNERQFKALNKSVLALAGPTAQAPQVLAEGLYDLVSSGFSAGESLTVLEASARAATAGLTTTEVAAKVVGSALKAYGRPAGDAQRISDILFRTVDRGRVTFEELAESLGPILPAARVAGVTLREVGAAMATLTIQGFPAAEAATAINGAIRQLFKPTTDLKAAFRELGVESGEQLVKKTGSLQAALQALRGTTDGSGTAFRRLFAEERGARAALALTGKNARSASKDLEGLKNSSGATARALKEQSKSTAFAWKQVSAEIQAVIIELGQTFGPAIAAGLRVLRTLIRGAAEASKAIRASFRAVGQFLIDVWTAPKKAFGDLFASILRGFAKLFDLASKLPLVGDKFKGLADTARGAARRVDQLGENINNLKDRRVKVRVDVALTPGPSGQLRPGDGWGVEDATQAAVQTAFDQGKLTVPLAGGRGSAALQGAGSHLAPFAKLGARMGLSVSSGYFGRENSITSSGNPSLHSVRRAIDMADGPAQMLAYARLMARLYGGRLAELIHTPLGFSIKNGQRVAPYATADHYNHVHVAMRRGGLIPGRGSGDKVPVLAEPGEGFINRRAVAALGGRRAIDAINRIIPRFQKGGAVDYEQPPGIQRGELRDFIRDVWGRVTGLTGSGISMPRFILGGEGSHEGGRVGFSEYRWSHAIPISNKMMAALENPRHLFHFYAKRVLIHEMAHAMQKGGMQRWETEGGAELFAKWAARKVYPAMGVQSFDYPAGYPSYVSKVRKEKPASWWRFGQFVGGSRRSVRAEDGFVASPGSGMQRAATAARAAGFRGKALQIALAVAASESVNFTDFIGDGGESVSPWQIHLPDHPQYDRARLLSDWTYAARAAYEISGGGRDWTPWTVYNTGTYLGYMDDAARVIAAGGRRGRRGVPERRTPTRAERREREQRRIAQTPVRGRARLTPVETYEERLTRAQFAFERAGGTETTRDDERAYKRQQKLLNEQLKRKQARLKKINQALRGKLRPATRRRLLAEKAQLAGEIGGLRRDRASLRAEFRERTAAPEVDPSVDPVGAYITEAHRPGMEQIEMQAALAGLTPGTEDDLAAAQARVASLETQLGGAMQFGAAPTTIAELANNLKSARDAVESLAGELEQQRQIQEEQRQIQEQLLAVQTEIDKNQKTIIATAQAQGPALHNALLMIVNGGIGGRAGLGRVFPSSTGLGGLART
jgi:TP901 family phage tail tape measure protein